MSQHNTAEYYFHQGTNYTSYKYLGCNREKDGNEFIYSFRTWAPSADSVAILSDLYGWNSPVYMERISEKGVWEYKLKSTDSLNGCAYKYRIQKGERILFKGDPYALYSKGGDDGASIIYHTDHKWRDGLWMKKRRALTRCGEEEFLSLPINIYEMHLGSFIRHGDGSYYSYREIAEVLVPYLRYMGYTHVEFMPLSEFPFDGSWGYQVCGFFAPTSRFGDPDGLRYLIDSLHFSGIGVILDWVPAHFPKDEWGLYEFDGTPLYEYQGKDRQESRSWGTRFFDVGREEVQSFLISSALYWFREFHIDGLRADAVASMLYLDYDRVGGEWIPNSDGGNINLESVAFFKKLNNAVKSEFPDVLMIAEESGAAGGITHDTESLGLGFDLKWNMGWANDIYDYVSTDPYFRKHKHRALNFPIMYAFDERYVLPISHDEVVHGKLSLINKMHGAYEDKFKEMRVFLLLMMTYPGKKLMFMGCEFAQFREWDHEGALEWFMLDYPTHRSMREYAAALNRFYLSHKELWDIDFSRSGFEWILADESEKNIAVYRRRDREGNALITALNFSGAEQTFEFESNEIKEIFNTGEAASLRVNNGRYEVKISAFSGAVFKEGSNIIKIKI